MLPVRLFSHGKVWELRNLTWEADQRYMGKEDLPRAIELECGEVGEGRGIWH
jgi:hypothetical protein